MNVMWEVVLVVDMKFMVQLKGYQAGRRLCAVGNNLETPTGQIFSN